MTKKPTTGGGQSLLISGALKMAKSKRPANNISLSRHELALLGDTRGLQAAIANHRHHQSRRTHRHHNHHNESTSSSSTTESISAPSSPALQESSTKSAPATADGRTASGAAGPHNQSALQHKQAAQGGGNSASNALIEGKNKKLFPQKLWDLINDERYNFCLRWSDDGQLVYLNRDEFEDSYLKTNENQFHTQKAISFVRQMNMYGFRKVDDCYYENDNFKRGCEHLLKNMTRKHPNKSSPSGAASQAGHAAGRQDLSSFLYHKSVAGSALGPAPGASLDSMASLFGDARNTKMAHMHLKHPLADAQQPVDLRCAIQQAGCSNASDAAGATGAARPPADINQNGQDLSHLLESLVAMSQASLLENSLRQQQEQQQLLQHHHQQAQAAHGRGLLPPLTCAAPMAAVGGQPPPGDDTMDAELDIMNNLEMAYYAGAESTAGSASPLPAGSPPVDPTIHISFNVGNTQNNFANPLGQQDQPLSLTGSATSREQQLLNTLHLFRLMLQFSAQNPAN